MSDLTESNVAYVAPYVHGTNQSSIRLPRLGANRFSDLVLEAIDQVLTDLLGRKARESVYDFLARERSISKSDLVAHLDDLSLLFADTFGRGGKTIERSIVRNLHAKLGWEFVEMSSCGLADYLRIAKDRFERELTSLSRRS